MAANRIYTFLVQMPFQCYRYHYTPVNIITSFFVVCHFGMVQPDASRASFAFVGWSQISQKDEKIRFTPLSLSPHRKRLISQLNKVGAIATTTNVVPHARVVRIPNSRIDDDATAMLISEMINCVDWNRNHSSVLKEKQNGFGACNRMMANEVTPATPSDWRLGFWIG